MKVTEWPVVSTILGAGPDDRVFGALLWSGPAVIAILIAAGRSELTKVLGIVYISILVGYVIYQAVQ